MNVIYRVACCAALASLSAPTFAKDKWAVQPVQTGQETVRYQKGVPTLDLELKDGVVQVTPLPLDHGSLAFGLAVYNDSRQPANMGIENISVQFGSAPVKVFTREDLERKAQNRAMWASLALAAAGGLAAAAAASQRNHYRSTLVTPRGTYRSYWSAPSAAGQVQAAALVAGTGVGIASINSQLDRTLEALGEEVIQLTTVDPGESYAGRIVIAKIKPTKLPAQVRLTVTWNGEAYPFTFQIAKRGTAGPVFTALTRPSDLTDFTSQPVAPASTDPAQPATVHASTTPGGELDTPTKKLETAPASPPSPVTPPATPTVAAASS